MGNSNQDGNAMPGDLEALARQYWTAMGDAMRNAAPGAAQAGTQPWQQAMDGWNQRAHGAGQQGNDAMDRFNTQAQQWFGQMQQVAAQFAGRDAGAADIANAWKHAMHAGTGHHNGNAFLDMLQGMRGPGLQGFEQWLEQVSSSFNGLGGGHNDPLSWLRTPTFGVAREHQQRWQGLALAQADYQQRTQAYNALMLKATQDAYAVFEGKLAQCEQPGRQIQSARALFDLWVDSAEEAYAKIALSQEFREVYGELVNAQMRLRGSVQREVEHACASFDIPTRTELDGAHRKIAELERQLRRLRDSIAASTAPAPTVAKASSPKKTVARDTTAAAEKSRPVRQTSAEKRAAVAKKAGVARKTSPVKKAAVVKRAAPAKKTAVARKAGAVKKAVAKPAAKVSRSTPTARTRAAARRKTVSAATAKSKQLKPAAKRKR